MPHSNRDYSTELPTTWEGLDLTAPPARRESDGYLSKDRQAEGLSSAITSPIIDMAPRPALQTRTSSESVSTVSDRSSLESIANQSVQGGLGGLGGTKYVQSSQNQMKLIQQLRAVG